MKEVVIVSGVRTAVGTFGGSLKSLSVVELGTIVMKDVLKRAGLRPVTDDKVKAYGPDALKDQNMIELEKKGYDYDDTLTPINIDEVIMGNVLQAGQGQNTARQAMIAAGIPRLLQHLQSTKYAGLVLRRLHLVLRLLGLKRLMLCLQAVRRA